MIDQNILAEKKKSHGAVKILAGNDKVSHQRKNSGAERKNFTAKEKVSRRNKLFRSERKFIATKQQSYSDYKTIYTVFQ